MAGGEAEACSLRYSPAIAMLGLYDSHSLSLFTHLRWTDRWMKPKDGWRREVRYICNPSAQAELRCHSERLKAFIGNDDVRQKAAGHPLVSVFLWVGLPADTVCTFS